MKGIKQKAINVNDLCIEILQFGTKHALNISVSMGIVLWEVVKKVSLV